MYMLKRFMVFSLCILVMTAFLGCVTPEANLNRGNSPAESLRPGFDVVYRPQIPPGKTWNSVLADLQQALRGVTWAYLAEDYLTYRWPRVVRNLAFLSNRLEILHEREYNMDSKTFTLFYYQLINSTIVVESARDNRQGRYAIILPEMVTFRKTDLTAAKRFADALFFIQQQVKNVMKDYDERLVLFEPIAARYRALATKPTVSEEQRKLIVQANVLAQQKQYDKAISRYQEVIKLDQTVYPEAYFNMALLAAQDNLPVTAIFFMRHYLLLKPDAKDARSAKDKIYEWEFTIKK